MPTAAEIDERKRLIAEGVAIYRSGRAAEAADVLGRCLSLFTDDERTSLEWADFCGNYGSALAEAGQLKQAEWMFNSALLVYGANGLREDLARTYFNLGNVRRYMNNRQGTWDNYGEALRLFRELGDARGEATTLLALVTHYLSMGLVDLARERLDEFDALDPAVARDPEIRWSWLFQKANLALLENEPARAVEHLEEALECAEATGDESYVAETTNALLHVRAQAGQAATEEELERTVDFAERRGGRQQLDVLFEAARSWADRGDFDRARPLFEQCLDLVDRTRGDLDGPERYHLMERTALVAQEYSARLVAEGDAPAAIAASERGQGRALLDLMFRHQIKRQGDRTVRAANSGRVVLDAPRVEAIRRFIADSGLHVLKILETQQGTLAFFAAPDGTLEAWDATAAADPLDAAIGLLLWQKAEIAEGTEPVAELHASTPAEAAPWEEVRSALARVYAALVPDTVRDRLESTEGRLLVVPHMSWFHLPWAELGPEDGEPLGARWEMAVAPSIGVFMQGSPNRDPEPWAGLDSFPIRAAAFGGIGERTVAVPLLPGTDAEIETHFRELEWTEAEARRVAELLDGGSVVDGNAYARAFRLVLRGAGVVHVASHGYWNPLVGELSFVLLAPEGPDDPGLLYGAQLQELTTRAELVALSGCQTGLGSSHPDSYISLAASFLIAGARCVLVSLWPIGDQATRAFVDEFYGRLARDTSPAAALKGAQNEFRDLLDPWDWAGFSLLGYPFHSFEPDPYAESVGGPAFCGGDVMWATDEPGGALPLEMLGDKVMTPDEGWLVRGGEIVPIRKR